jgi:ATP-dependent Clp protease adaptor protein ClpS
MIAVAKTTQSREPIMSKQNKPGLREDTGTQTLEKQKTARPPMYEVLLHNDDYTTREFVVYVLMRFFQKSEPEATQIMLHVHHKGIGVCGVYTFDVAETKVTQVLDSAKEHGMPLQCSMQKAP